MTNTTQPISDLNVLETEERKIYTAVTILIAVLSFVGIVGNGHILVVYTSMKQSNPRVFILTLGIIDLVTCATVMPFVIVNSQMPFTFSNSPLCKVFSAIGYFLTVSSGFVLLMIAIDRYWKICKPLKRQISKREAKVMCVTSMFVTLLLVWPSPVLLGINKFTLNDNLVGTECTFLDEYKESSYILAFNGVLLLTALFVFTSLVVLYSLVRRTIVKHDKYRNSFERGPKRETISKLVMKPSITMLTHNIGSTASTHLSDSKRSFQNGRPSSTSSYTPSSMYSLVNLTHRRRFESLSTYTSTMSVRRSSCISLPDILDTDNQRINNESRKVTISKSLDNISGPDIFKTDALDAAEPTKRRSLENIYKIFKSHKSSMAARLHMRNRRTTLMFVWITVIFFLSFVSHQVMRVAAFVDPNLVKNLSFGGKVAYNFFLWCVFINNMSNWIVYGYWDIDFRNRTKRMYVNIFSCFKSIGK